MANKKLKVGKVPNLRFPEFSEQWEIKKLGSFGEKVNTKNKENKVNLVFSNSAIQGIVLQSEYFDKRIANKNNLTEYYIVKPFDFVYNPRISSNAEVGAMSVNKTEKTGLVSPLYTVFRINENSINISFLEMMFKSKVWHNYMRSIANYGARDDRMNIKNDDFFALPIKIPSIQEQEKIASFLSLIDERIQTQTKIIEKLKLLKNTIRYRLFKQILNEENELVQIKDILNYEQPTKYLVINTDYSSDATLIPVLTANKAFVLGYTDEDFGIYDKDECIIFDDFTMDIKFVNFPFKVKSSAIKVLTAKPNVNLKFIFEYLSFLDLSSNEHKRHYISEIELMDILLPDYHRQKQIAIALSSIDEKIKTESEIHTLQIMQKQYLLTNLFI